MFSTLETLRRRLFVLLLPALLGAVCPVARAQDAQYGVAMPFEISGGYLDTERAQYLDPSAPRNFAAFRLLLKPEIKLGSHWFSYFALQVRSTPYFYDDAYSSQREVKFNVLQGFLGYSRNWNRTALTVKAGQLASAFGAFPLRYSDMENSLLDQPLMYNYLLLQPMPGSNTPYGLTPVTLYGLPAAEVDFTRNRLDTRFQFTLSNPYNPRDFFTSGQYPQWTAGGGYTIVQGFRVGVSAYRGPWLVGSLASAVPAGSSPTHYPATAVGADVQWARGRWSATGEWDEFIFHFPILSNAPTMRMGYAEAKAIITPRWYSAFRANYQTDNHAVIYGMVSPATVFPNREYYEAAVGFRPDRFQLIKVGYEWAFVHNGEPNHNNVLGIQFVTAINGLSKAFK